MSILQYNLPDLHGPQVLRHGADHQLLGFVIREKVDTQQVFRVVSHLEMPVEGIFAGFFGVGHLVLDLVLARGELNGQIPELRHIERPAILSRTPAVHFLHRQPVKAVVPVIGGQKVQRIAEQTQIDAPYGSDKLERLIWAIQ